MSAHFSLKIPLKIYEFQEFWRKKSLKFVNFVFCTAQETEIMSTEINS